MTAKELQDAMGVYRNQPDADGVNRGNIWALPLDIRENTFKAFNVAFASGTGLPVYTQGAPTGRYIAPSGLNCNQAFVGGCGFQNLVLKGPSFFRSDLSVVKRIRFSENTNLELRGEMLNAFNNINFLIGNASNDINTLAAFGSANFARYTNAYQDISTTNDPVGRSIQLLIKGVAIGYVRRVDICSPHFLSWSAPTRRRFCHDKQSADKSAHSKEAHNSTGVANEQLLSLLCPVLSGKMSRARLFVYFAKSKSFTNEVPT